MPPFAIENKSDATFARYNRLSINLNKQYLAEVGEPGWVNTEDVSIAAAKWFLRQNRRWARTHIRLLAAALTQSIEALTASGLVSETIGLELLTALRSQRPESAKEDLPRHPAWREQQQQNKTLRPQNLRRLTRHLGAKKDDFSKWISGYLQIGSRAGWRPGELLRSRCENRILSAPAEKVGENRGLFPTVELIIGADYPERFIAGLRLWITETPRWTEKYGDQERLMAAMRERIRRACQTLKLPIVSPYVLRHFAIASLKKSGWTRAEIAALVNHLSDRTVTEHYGKGRSGRKRPRALFRVDPARVKLVRRAARTFTLKLRPDHQP